LILLREAGFARVKVARNFSFLRFPAWLPWNGLTNWLSVWGRWTTRIREFVDAYNRLLSASGEAQLVEMDAFIAHTVEHFDQENRWMELIGFPGCHKAEHDRVLAVCRDVRKRMERGDAALGASCCRSCRSGSTIMSPPWIPLLRPTSTRLDSIPRRARFASHLRRIVKMARRLAVPLPLKKLTASRPAPSQLKSASDSGYFPAPCGPGFNDVCQFLRFRPESSSLYFGPLALA
jgi:hypothetical protein